MFQGGYTTYLEERDRARNVDLVVLGRELGRLADGLQSSEVDNTPDAAGGLVLGKDSLDGLGLTEVGAVEGGLGSVGAGGRLAMTTRSQARAIKTTHPISSRAISLQRLTASGKALWQLSMTTGR